MFTNETFAKLREMHLGAMARQFKTRMDDPQYASMSFEDRIGLLVDVDWAARKSNHLSITPDFPSQAPVWGMWSTFLIAA